jgi:conjugative relaxase-like TrwC/TraI family protein
MAWMRMMGANSVEYHRETVVDRGDDHAGQALAYYAERGESPLRWGGAGAGRLGLDGVVGADHYDDLFGVGGARDPITGTRLVKTRRPGMELVVSAHKAVAELGVIGRAGDMHRIMDAERDGTLAYLDAVTLARGGRRGKSAVSSPTSGLVYAHTRHATSRAGDPCPHDHVLIVNAVGMLDRRGGWKAPDTTVWREHLHAATAYGRVCSARVALELGYGIVPDDGPSGRLGHWAIAGIPEAAMKLHSKRADDIAGELVDVGFDSYRARAQAARTTRKAKRHQPVEDLMARWTAELNAIGITVDDLARSVVDESHRRIAGDLSPELVQSLVADALGPKGRLAERKVFSRRDVLVAVAPQLFGHTADTVEDVVERVLADPAAIPLVGVAGAKERPYAPACVIVTEHAIAAMVEAGLGRDDAPRVSPAVTTEAMIAKQRSLGGILLTPGQQRAVSGITGSGRGVDLVVGVAGAGKTTALDAVRLAFEAEGYTVIGAATSGQAARTLGRDANLRSSTLASLLWRLDHQQTQLTGHTVVILDEAGMTDDPDLVRLLTAAASARAKVVMIGDDRQLGAVGPGGSLGALVDRHRPGVWVLDQNVRQTDPGERAALDELRAGDVGSAVDWMAAHGRVAVRADHADTIGRMVAAWAAEVDDGLDAMMLAWKRSNVDALNRAARQIWVDQGRLSGPEIEASGGRLYRAGDRIVTLAPGGRGQIVTSERGTVTAVQPTDGSLRARMDDGRIQAFSAEHIGKDRMTYGYAITVHRSQGATADTLQRLEDGGGRELAYVSMSRARHRSTVWVTADDLDQAVEDLKHDWAQEHRQTWAIDSGTPSTDPAAVEHDHEVDRSLRDALRQARLSAERAAVVASIQADPTSLLQTVREALRAERQALVDLDRGAGRWAGTRIGNVAKVIAEIERDRQDACWRSNSLHATRGEVRTARRDIKRADVRLGQGRHRLETLAAPRRTQVVSTIAELEARIRDLEVRADVRTDWLAAHPEITRRLELLDSQLDAVGRAIQVRRDDLDGVDRTPTPIRTLHRSLHQEILGALPPPQPDASRRLIEGPDLGLGL